MPRTIRKKPQKKQIRKIIKPKKCIFTEQKIEYIDYKDIEVLKRFISPVNGRIIGRKFTGLSAKNQRRLTTAIKQAREVALLPFVASKKIN